MEKKDDTKIERTVFFKFWEPILQITKEETDEKFEKILSFHEFCLTFRPPLVKFQIILI